MSNPEGGADILRFFPYSKGKPRPTQEDAIRRIEGAFAAGKRMVALQAPVGSGKTFIGHTFAAREAATGGSTFFLSPQRAHQDQYHNDFPSDVEPVKGRTNYRCEHRDAKKWMDASNGVCRQRDKGILPDCVRSYTDGDMKEAMALRLPADRVLCPYFRQMKLGADSPTTAFNFASFLHQQRLGRFGHRSLMIVDECHNCESEVVRFVELSLSERTLDPIGVVIDRTITDQGQLVRWMDDKKLEERVRARLGSAMDVDGAVAEGLTAEETDRLKTISERLDSFRQKLSSTEWVVETVEAGENGGEDGDDSRKIRCRPLSARPFMKGLILSKADRILFMSGTILDFRLWARNLGLYPEEVEYIEEPCTFPAKNRPIILDYAGDMSQRNIEKTMPAYLKKMAEILDRHRGQKGIIHCHSFKLGEVLRALSSPRLLFQRDFENDKTRMLSEHDRRGDTVLVSPGMAEGVDLKDDRSRFQVLAKVPWPNLGDRLIARRKELYEPYYQWLTAVKLVQSYGRSVRCFDRETEILTTGGWKGFDQLKPGDIAFGIRPDGVDVDRHSKKRPMRNGRLVVIPNPVMAVNVPDFPEKTVHIQSRSTDILVTPDHSMIIQTKRTSFYPSTTRRHGKTYRYVQQHVLRSTGLKKIPARELPSRFKIPCAGWIARRPRTGRPLDWFWLMGFIIGDGSISKTLNQVCIFQSTAESQNRQRTKINATLKRLGLRYRYYESDNVSECYGYKRNGRSAIWIISGYDSARIRDMFHRGRLRRYSRKKTFRKRRHKGVDGWKIVDKLIPTWILERASVREMLALVEGMMDADGTARTAPKVRSPYGNGQYWTSDPVLAGQLQSVLALSGYKSSISSRNRSHLKNIQFCVNFSMPGTIDIVKTACIKEGPVVHVWCPSTILGTVLARRRGKTFIAGNSESDFATTYVTDQGFESFRRLCGRLVPKWMKDAIGIAPAAPALLF